MSSWVRAGGLASIKAMERAAAANPNDPRLAGFKLPRADDYLLNTRARAYVTPITDPRLAYFKKYQFLVDYAGKIKAAAKRWGVPAEALAAVIIYEYADLETVGTRVATDHGLTKAAKKFLGIDRKTSYGLAQLEPYKVQRALKYFKKKELGVEAIIDKLLTPEGSFDYAAMYLKYLKKTITVRKTSDGGGYYNAPISWEDATVAYCGCAGVTESKSTGKWSTKAYTDWMAGNPLRTQDNEEGVRRYNAMQNGGWAYEASREYLKEYG
ncbi:hypothetical protein ACIHFD_66725 [Nonomuraea sp. NPDC051941]|uniref:hypothetical protein n=1 Tax=Nonomuraea sp. NPDC051941 TaxID=3364373 RepID=UPI0037C5CB12